MSYYCGQCDDCVNLAKKANSNLLAPDTSGPGDERVLAAAREAAEIAALQKKVRAELMAAEALEAQESERMAKEARVALAQEAEAMQAEAHTAEVDKAPRKVEA